MKNKMIKKQMKIKNHKKKVTRKNQLVKKR